MRALRLEPRRGGWRAAAVAEPPPFPPRHGSFMSHVFSAPALRPRRWAASLDAQRADSVDGQAARSGLLPGPQRARALEEHGALVTGRPPLVDGQIPHRRSLSPRAGDVSEIHADVFEPGIPLRGKKASGRRWLPPVQAG